jgi:hypothetical protein
VSDPRIAKKATETQTPNGEARAEDEGTARYPGLPRGPRGPRSRWGTGADELSADEAALVDRFVKGLKGQLYTRTKNGICSRSPFPYFKVALDWALHWH